MPKDKGKKSIKSDKLEENPEKSLKGNKIDWSKYPKGTTEINNPNFHFGSDRFVFKNGDRYVGEYCAHKCGLVWREGKGCYVTNDGHSYEGFWENDQLLSSEKTIIKYPDGTEYHGPVKQGMYSGVGTYIPDKNLEVTLNLEDNIPFGKVILTDNRKHLWIGNNVNPLTGEVLLLPENHFFTNLQHDAGIGKIVCKPTLTENDDSINQIVEEEKHLTADQLKNLVFKPSTKIPNHFEDNFLYRNTKFKFSEKTKIDFGDQTPKNRIPKPKSSLLKARSGSNSTLWNEFVNQRVELAQGKSATTIMNPTVDKMEEENSLSNNSSCIS